MQEKDQKNERKKLNAKFSNRKIKLNYVIYGTNYTIYGSK